MAVRKFRKTWSVDIRFNGQRKRIRSPENSRTGALAFETVLRQRLARGEPLEGDKPIPKILLKDFVGEWMENYVKNNNKPSEQRSKVIILKKHIIPFFGNKELGSINAMSMEQYKTYKLSQKLSPKTIAKNS